MLIKNMINNMKYKCETCGKEYSVERHYLAHIKKCKPLEVIEETEVIETEPEIKPVLQEVFEWFDALNGRISANEMEISRMIGWYMEIFDNPPHPGGYGCQRCVMHVYNSLKKLYTEKKGNKKCKNC